MAGRKAVDMNVTSLSVFHTKVTVSIGLRNVLRMVTSILQNKMSMLRSRARQSLSFILPQLRQGRKLQLLITTPSVN